MQKKKHLIKKKIENAEIMSLELIINLKRTFEQSNL